jgi:hypothetical protein
VTQRPLEVGRWTLTPAAQRSLRRTDISVGVRECMCESKLPRASARRRRALISFVVESSQTANDNPDRRPPGRQAPFLLHHDTLKCYKIRCGCFVSRTCRLREGQSSLFTAPSQRSLTTVSFSSSADSGRKKQLKSSGFQYEYERCPSSFLIPFF